MGIILRCKKGTSVESMLDTLHWMNVEQRIVYKILIVVFQIKNGLMPKCLTDKLKYVSDHSQSQNHNLSLYTKFL